MENTPPAITVSTVHRAKNQAQIALFEQGFSALSILFFGNGVGTILNEHELIMKLLRYAIFGIAVLLMGARWRTTLRTISKGGLLWLVVGLMVASMAWSVSPIYTSESIRGEVLPMTAFAAYFASRFNIRQQMRIIAATLALGAFLSLFYALAIPSVGRHIGDKFDGAWKGIYAQKNVFSSVMALTMLVFFILSLANKNRQERFLARCGLVFSILLILLSTSVSGLIVFIVLLLIVLASRLFRWRGRRSVLLLDVGGLIVLCLGTVLSATWQGIVIGLGKDPTLSARTYIWSGSIEKIMDQPLLGYGRAAFWVPGSQDAWEVGALAARDFVPSHAHNGYIDAALDLGLIGFGLFVLGLVISFGMALRRAYRASEPEDLWPFAFLTLMMIYNITESVLMLRTSLYWVMYMSIFLSLRRWPRRSRAEKAH
ncbi:MAG: O-antigen ligase [Cyanobacteria bacterium J06634_5]